MNVLIAYSKQFGIGFYVNILAELRTAGYNDLVTKEATEEQLSRALKYLSYAETHEEFNTLRELRAFLTGAHDTEHPTE